MQHLRTDSLSQRPDCLAHPLAITILGSGTSHGVPMIACDCPVCTSFDPRDRRTRASIAVQWEQVCLLIDTAPELRLQCLANGIRRADAVLYTHHHFDHLAGLDDLRRFNHLQGRELPCYGQSDTLERIRAMFGYAFEYDPEYPSAKPELTLEIINGPFTLFGRTITPIPLWHGKLPILGYRIGSFAYCTDVSEIPAESWSLLRNLDVLILDALRRRPHPTHFNLAQAIDHAQRIAARQTFFTHIAHELSHAETTRQLPENMALAYDGLVISC